MVTAVADNAPIPLPRSTSFIEPVAFTEAYVRRPIVDALDASRTPRARDVNALDEVPRSSYWLGAVTEPERLASAYAVAGPPRSPLVLKKDRGRTLEIEDGRGYRYLLEADPDAEPNTRSAAAAISSRLLRALGYRSPEVWVVTPTASLPELGRAPAWSATRWPVGIDLGPTPASERRSDDPNDRIEPTERRTLRVLGIVAAWLDIGDLGPAHLRDVYRGPPGKGHVEHYVVGLRTALGVRHLIHGDGVETAAGTVRGSPLVNLVTLGLHRPATQIEDEHSLRAFPLSAEGFDLGMPFDPIDHLLPGDEYWIAELLTHVSTKLLAAAVRAGSIADAGVARHLRRALEARRAALVSRHLLAATPCAVTATTERLLVFEDRAVAEGVVSGAGAHYLAELFDERGRPLGPARRLNASLGEIELSLPRAARVRSYVIARLHAEYPEHGRLPPVEVHLSRATGVLRVIGIRR